MQKEKIESIKKQFFVDLESAQNEVELFDLEKKYLGRKSEFTEIMKSLGSLSVEDKKIVGPLANGARKEIADAIEVKKTSLRNAGFDFDKERIDITIPGKKRGTGHLNPISLVLNEIQDIFTAMGFEISDGPEIETEFYNFDALNIPEHHPARDMQDTFWLKQTTKNQKTGKEDRLSLRSQTSAAQVKYMEQNTPPFKIIVPGKVFRSEATDSTHEHTFYQFESLVVGENINVGNLKFVAQEFFSLLFKQDVKVRLRPSYFPFVEPGFEFDITCTVCHGKGCKACRYGGWLELGGAGMVNQNVFEAAGYPRGKYTGFAWGFGLERLAMMKYKIDDVRLFHSGDLRFIRQF